MKDNRKGQSLVEFTLMLGIFLLLMSGVIDVGRAVVYHYLLTDAAEEGALYGSVCPRGDVAGRVKKSLNTFQPNELSVEATCTNNCVAGDTITVKVTYNMRFISPLGGMFFPDHNEYTIQTQRQHIIITDATQQTLTCAP